MLGSFCLSSSCIRLSSQKPWTVFCSSLCTCPMFTDSDTDVSLSMTDSLGRKLPRDPGWVSWGVLGYLSSSQTHSCWPRVGYPGGPCHGLYPRGLLIFLIILAGSTGEHETGPGRHPLPPSHPTPTKQRSILKSRRRERRAPQALINQGWGPKTLWVQVKEEAELEGPL